MLLGFRGAGVGRGHPVGPLLSSSGLPPHFLFLRPLGPRSPAAVGPEAARLGFLLPALLGEEVGPVSVKLGWPRGVGVLAAETSQLCGGRSS